MSARVLRSVVRDEHRSFLHPESGARVPGVTSILNNVPKPHLKVWAQRLVAEAAVENWPEVGNLAEANPEAAVAWLKKAPDRVTAHAAKVGHIAHSYFEELALGNTIGRVDPELQPFVDHFKDYLDVMQPEFLLLEEGVWSEKYNYAGTFDAVVRYNQPNILMGDVPLVGVSWQDNKTTRSGLYPEVGLQLAAYRFAEYLVRPDGTFVDNRPGDFATALHVRPEGWELVPVSAGQAELDVFYHLRAVTEYSMVHSRTIIQPRVAGNRARRGPRGGAK